MWLRKHGVVNSRESSREKNWCNILKRSKWHAPKLCFWHKSEPDSHERAVSQAAWRHENQLTETGFERKSLRRATPPDTEVWSMTSAKPEAVLNSTSEQSPVASAQLWKLSTFRPQNLLKFWHRQSETDLRSYMRNPPTEMTKMAAAFYEKTSWRCKWREGEWREKNEIVPRKSALNSSLLQLY